MSGQQCTISESSIDAEEFASQLNAFKEGFRLEMGKRRKQKSRAKLLDERGKEAIKKDQNERKSKSDAKIKEEKGIETFKTETNYRKAKSRAEIKEKRGEEALKRIKTNLKHQVMPK